MPFFRSSALVVPLFALALSSPAVAQDVISYEVKSLAKEKSFQVLMEIPKIKDLTVRLQIPVWSPGAYAVGNYAASIADITATDTQGKSLRVFHPEPNTWDVAANGAKTIRVSYTVKNSDLEDVDGVPKRAHIRGPRTYLYVVGRKAEPVTLSVVPPPNAKVWKIAVGLEGAKVSGESPQGAAAAAKFRYTASSYDVLADAPVEMGDYVEDSFTSGGKIHQVVLYGNYANIDRAKLVEYCRRVADYQTAFFGDAPFPHYVFMFRAAGGPGGGAGGLEHLSSTEIGISGTVGDVVRSVIAHEYFHLWNVKRIRPFVLGPFDYVSPPRTANLWWSEGVTSYYGDLLSRRSGINTDAEYFKHLADTITELQNTPGRLTISADEASMRVWDGGFGGFGGLSYYTKGELVGLCLDLEIRKQTQNRKSLDDVMKSLYTQVKRGNGPGFAEDDIKATVNRISGQDLSEFYDIAARSTEELPLAKCLSYAGLTLAPAAEPRMVTDLGMTTTLDRETRTLRILAVVPSGAADAAGLKVDDRIVAINGQADLLQMNQLRRTAPGTKLPLTVQRGNEKLDIEYTVGSRPFTVYQLTIDPNATPEQNQLRQAWLGGK